MITPKLCFAAVGIIRDADTNTISAFTILEGVIPSAIPFYMPQVSFVVFWDRNLDDANRTQGVFTLTINNDQVSRVEMLVDFHDGLRHRTIANLNGLVIPRTGAMRFRIDLDVGVHAEYLLEVEPPRVAAAPQVQAV